MRNIGTDIVVYSMIVAGILVMTRPKSQGPSFVKALTGGYANIVQAASGQPLTGYTTRAGGATGY